MAKRRRELLKFRDGDVGLKIRKDGQLELAGISEKHGMIDKNGMVNPAMLFASAWARRDPKVFQVLVDNFKESVREGYFGDEAKRDYDKALKAQEEHSKSLQEQNIAVKKPSLVGLRLIFFNVIFDPLINNAATIKNAAEEKSPGSVRSAACNAPPG